MINKFATDVFRKDGNFRDDKTRRHIQQDYVMLTRYLLSHFQTDQIRPLLNNEESHILLKNLNYSRGGNIKTGFQTFIESKGVRILDLNTRTMKFVRPNQETPEAQEYNSLFRKLFNKNEKLINRISEKTNKSTQVREIINNSEPTN